LTLPKTTRTSGSRTPAQAVNDQGEEALSAEGIRSAAADLSERRVRWLRQKPAAK
jgi:hypothetical protein